MIAYHQRSVLSITSFGGGDEVAAQGVLEVHHVAARLRLGHVGQNDLLPAVKDDLVSFAV